MTRTRQFIVAGLVAIAAAAAGFGLNAWRSIGGGPDGAEAVFAARLADLEGRPQPIDQWRGRVLVINFWATWCAPCREEIPGFVRLQKKYGGRGVQFVGIAIDQPGPVAQFAREFGMNYPILLGGADAIELSRQAGNRAGALPFTVILDRAGRIAGRKLGDLKESRLEDMIQPLL